MYRPLPSKGSKSCLWVVGWMYQVDVYLRVRRAVIVDGMSIREVSRVFGMHRDTVRKILAYSVPPGYRRETPPQRPKLEPFTGVIDQILVDDLRRPRKQRHTAQRIFQRLRDEHGFGGQYTIVKDYVREHRRRSQEMFVPLSHPPGHAQCDFGEALVIIGGVEQKAHCFVLDLPHSDGCFVKAYPAGTTEAFLDGHVSAFACLGGVPQSILYNNTKLTVARILGDGRRKSTRAFTELQSHYLFDDRFGRPGKGNDKGKVEGMVGYMRRNFLVPVPSFASFDALNAHLERRCLARMATQALRKFLSGRFVGDQRVSHSSLWQSRYFLPLPQGQGLLLPRFNFLYRFSSAIYWRAAASNPPLWLYVLHKFASALSTPNCDA